MKTSAIGWCDYSGGDLNFVTGCTKVSEGCKNCFAEAIYKRFKRDFSKVVVHPEKLWRLPRKRFPEYSPKRGEPYRPMAFLCDTGDIFHEDVPAYFLIMVFNDLVVQEDIVWQILTKRPERMRSFLGFWLRARNQERLPSNFWLGVSVSNQRTADERIPILVDTPAAVRFVSIEPMLEPVEMGLLGIIPKTIAPRYTPVYEYIDWIIVGAESGPNRRPFDVAWAADILHQCQEADVSCFLKQDSALRPGKPLIVDGRTWHEWPEVKS